MKMLFFLLLLTPAITFGQQFLWTTAKVGKLKNSDVNLVSLDVVTNKVLEYYDYYDYYYDFRGVSKEGMMEILKEDSHLTDSPLLSDGSDVIYEPFAMAFKTNYNNESIVGVVFRQQGKVDLMVFTNSSKEGSIPAVSSDTEQFEKTLHTFWGYRSPSSQFEDPLSSGYEKESEKLEQIELILDYRHFDIAPEIEDEGQLSGKVAVEIRVNRDGKITAARAGIRGTTIINNALYEKCERSALAARLNRSENAASVETGVIVFNF